MLRNMSPTAVFFIRHAAVAAALSCSMMGVGCAYGEMPQVLRAQVATEASCPDITVSQAPAYTPGFDESQYKVRGCNIERLYTCKNPPGELVKFGAADCSYVAAGTPPKAPADAAPASPGAGGEAEPGLDEPDGAGDTSG